MSFNASAHTSDRYQQYHQLMASRIASTAFQNLDDGGEISPTESGVNWCGDNSQPSIPPQLRSLPSNTSDHLQTPATTPFPFDPVPKPYQQVLSTSTDQSMFTTPSHAYQQSEWEVPAAQYSEGMVNQLSKPLPIPSQYSTIPSLNTYDTPSSTFIPIPVASSYPPTPYQVIPPRRPSLYISGSLPPTNLRNVSVDYALPVSMRVAPSQFDSPYAPRPTGNVFVDARASLPLPPPGSSGYTPCSAIPLTALPLKSASLSPPFPCPNNDLASVYQPLQPYLGDLTPYPMDLIPDTTETRSGYLSATSAPDLHRSSSFAGPSSPPLRPVSEAFYPMPQTAIPIGHVDHPIMRRNSIDTASKSGETRNKHLRKRVTSKSGETVTEWETVLERKERRQTQNRLAQRAFRARTKIAESNSATTGWSTAAPLVIPSSASEESLEDTGQAIHS